MNFKQGNTGELLKEGTTHYEDNVTLKNIEAVKELAQITRTSMGPHGLNKMVINHLGKLIVTHDASTIMTELEVVHPAAKILALASRSMEQEMGDGSNLVLTLGAEFLIQAERLLKMGLHPSDIIQGYKKVCTFALSILDTFEVDRVDNVRDLNQIVKAMTAAVAAKQFGYTDLLCPIIAEACITVCPKNPLGFSTDNVRVVKIAGGSVYDTRVVKGFVLPRDTNGSIKHVKNAKIAVFGVNVDVSSTETKGVVELSSADELLTYNLSEEQQVEREIQALADAGINVVVSKGSFGDMALHYIERHKMMAVKVVSQFDLRRLCKAIGASAMVRIGAPTQEEMGSADSVDVEEIGSQKVIIFRQDNDEDTQISTVVVRGATDNILSEMERAIDDGVNVFKTLTKDARLVAGAGAFEAELSRQLTVYGEKITGLDQYAIRKYAESFMVIPKTLTETCGLNPTDVVSKLTVAHQNGKANWGVDLENIAGKDVVKAGILDLMATKKWAITLASDAATQILSVDLIIMARPAGVKAPQNPNANPGMSGKGDWDTD
eukprot:CAMPEP_0117445300 /NCGR_PEP_ID=MMETSP0759-20121206/5719_1 /TAXON_ID=63605 /ORGANISM="Percolomonas cosmopolitus, Strain WS" /LENGTH=548 /DNA_ID=CAMNT_0005237461 /DNA_START=53 /DNA_END=1699 /DNA_ORIENTATION=-